MNEGHLELIRPEWDVDREEAKQGNGLLEDGHVLTKWREGGGEAIRAQEQQLR